MVTIQESDRPVKVCSQKDKRHPTQNRVPHFVMQSFPEDLSPRQHLVETLRVGQDLHVRQILKKELL